MHKLCLRFVLGKYEFVLVSIIYKILIDNMQHTFLHTFIKSSRISSKI